MEESSRSHTSVPYLLFILTISIVGILLLAISTLVQLTPETRSIVDSADTGICVLFLFDFGLTLVRARRKWHYLATWGWLDLVSSIPIIHVLRVARFARVVRIVRVMRAIRSGRILALFIMERRTQSAFLATALLFLLFTVFGSVAILQFERVPEANIKGSGDALWWTIVTLTTVGYGDRYPVTADGRVLATILMIAGVGLFGTLSGFVASWFLAPREREQESEIASLRKEILELKVLLERPASIERTADPAGPEKVSSAPEIR